jgi:hypothetical protein
MHPCKQATILTRIQNAYAASAFEVGTLASQVGMPETTVMYDHRR